MTLRELHALLTPLLAKHGESEVQALIDTPDEFVDGLLTDVNIHDTKPRIVLCIEQQ